MRITIRITIFRNGAELSKTIETSTGLYRESGDVRKAALRALRLATKAMYELLPAARKPKSEGKEGTK